MILKLHGHIGSTASALVDGQLAPEDEERAWSHVLTCPGCRRLVEREGWIKQRLAGLSEPGAAPVPSGLVSTLAGIDDHLGTWAHVEAIERRSNVRRAAVALAGAGTVGVAALAIVALSSTPAGNGQVPAERGPAVIRPDVVRSAVDGAVGSGAVPVAEPDVRRRAAR